MSFPYGTLITTDYRKVVYVIMIPWISEETSEKKTDPAAFSCACFLADCSINNSCFLLSMTLTSVGSRKIAWLHHVHLLAILCFPGDLVVRGFV